ncbi:MAG: sigma-54 dependent transcriptional regulator [Myxococcota bacterium]
MGRVLVVDDEAGVRESLRMLLKDDCEVVTAANVAAALRALEEAPPDLVLLDLIMPGGSGLGLLEALSGHDSAPPVVVLTATKTVTTAVEAMKLGAADYVTKPFEVDALRIKVRQLLEHRALQEEVMRLRREVSGHSRLGRMIGRSTGMREVFHTIERVASSRASVLISGESGTGKELVARALHDLSPRKDAPFVVVNCAAIPETLLESELFGHERGAFTDARERRIGRFEAASGGTLFLDEIAEMAPALQAKLLRALQERSVERLGSSQPIDVDVRFVAATNRDLDRDVAQGRFRADLYYRVAVVPIPLPPLRERREDVRLLVGEFLTRAAAQAGREPLQLDTEALAALERYAWPGNVRELENVIERAVTLSEGSQLGLSDLPASILQAEQLEALREGVRAGRFGFDEAVARFEKDLLQEALERHGWNQTRAATQLSLTRRQLKLKMDRHGLASPTS